VREERADPAAAAVRTDGAAFEPFHLERERKPDGRAILFYSWPDEPPVPAGLGTAQEEARSAPEAEPWSPETQPVEPEGQDV